MHVITKHKKFQLTFLVIENITSQNYFPNEFNDTFYFSSHIL